MRSDDVAKFPPVSQVAGKTGGLNESSVDSDQPGSDLQQQLEEMLNPKTPEMDPKAMTKQMLLTCKVFRKRNSNVTPLTSKAK